MLFLMQSFLEDYFVKLGYSDSDGYIVKLTNIYFYQRHLFEYEVFLGKINKVKTIFYSNNRIQKRKDFEKTLLSKLDTKFKKGLPRTTQPILDRQLAYNKITKRRINILNVLEDFKTFTQARVIDSFWKSRIKNHLVEGPEKIAQSLLATYFQGALMGRAIVLRELGSGIGYIDIVVIISSTLHIVELKILTNGFLGVEQLENYMEIEKRNRGILVVFDAMSPKNKIVIPPKINTKQGVINVVSIDINPNPPSSLNVLKK